MNMLVKYLLTHVCLPIILVLFYLIPVKKNESIPDAQSGISVNIKNNRKIAFDQISISSRYQTHTFDSVDPAEASYVQWPRKNLLMHQFTGPVEFSRPKFMDSRF